MVKRCLYCGKRLTQPKGRGRRREYCSDAHKNRSYRARVRVILAKHRGAA